MGDVVSTHLDEAKREIISVRTTEVMGEFGRLYEQQYAVSLFNKVRFDIEGGIGLQPQLLHRKVPLEDKSIFSGSLFQYLEDNKKWRNRFLFIPDSYNINLYENKAAYDKRLHPKGTINCAGYKVLTSLDQYLELISNSLPGVKAKVGSSPFLKCATQFPLFLWHPYARHIYFCVTTEKEQEKWHAVLQDCIRHSNDGLSEENKIQTPAFTDAVRLHRQAHGHYGTWEMMCGVPPQILSNLVMEGLHPELRDLISPRLKGKLHDRQRNWMLISDAVYSMVQEQCQEQYEAMLQRCEGARSSLEGSIRTDMDQIITSKEHVTNKIRAVVLPKAEKLLKVSIQPYIGSILDALMEPTSRGFSEVREVFFRELVDMSKNTLNEGTKETVAQHMEKISMLAYHPVKMQSCYEKVEQLSLEGLQQRFDVSSPSVFVQRAQILMREQMDDAVYTFEQILHQSLEAQGSEDICKTIQRCQDRVIKKFDYDSSTVRKRFFREALLQIFIPYMLKQLNPSCAPELPRFQELIFEDFSKFILVENIFEEVVLHSVMKDIMMAVKEAAVQRRHNLYRDSIVLSNSDPSLHLLGENPSIDWAGQYGGAPEETDGAGEEVDGAGGESYKKRRLKQVVSMIQVEGTNSFPGESCLEVPGVDDIPEETDGEEDEADDDANTVTSEAPSSMSNGSVVTHVKSEEVSPKEKNDVVLKEQVAVALEVSTNDNSVNVVKQEAVAPVDKQVSAPVVDQASAPVVDQASAPVVDQASAPVVDQASAPVVDQASAPVVDQASAPVVDQASAPVVDQASAPVVDQASAPVVDQASAPVVDQASAPVVDQASAPVVDQASAPVVDQASAPVVDQASAPVVDQASAPVVDQASAPVVDQASAPVVDQASAPVVDQASAPVVDQASAPVVDQASAPVVDQASAPVVDQASAPVVDQASAPVVDQASAPVVDQASAPVEGLASAPVEGLASAPVEGLASAPVEGLASAPVADQASAPVKDQASAIMEVPASPPVENQPSSPVEEKASATMEVQTSTQVEVQESVPVEDQGVKEIDCKVSEVLVVDPVVVEEQPPTIKTEEEAKPPPNPTEDISSDTVMPAKKTSEEVSTLAQPPHDDSGSQPPASDVVEMPTKEESVVT